MRDFMAAMMWVAFFAGLFRGILDMLSGNRR
jgi:hypothetical protein